MEPSHGERALAAQVRERFGEAVRVQPESNDHLTLWAEAARVPEVMGFLKHHSQPRHQRLDDLTAVDESARRDPDQRAGFTLSYQALSFDGVSRVRVKAALDREHPQAPSLTEVWPSANWYEREAHDLFGIQFTGHPDLRRILLPHDWEGHPLRKDYLGRATEHAPFTMGDAQRHQPEDGDALVDTQGGERMVLNLGPHHYSTHGLLRVVLALDGETIEDLALDIGFHHRGVEKFGERQSWHQFFALHRPGGLPLGSRATTWPTSVPWRPWPASRCPPGPQFIRIMLTELYRLSNHLLFYGTFVQDLGAMTPIFYQFREREMIMDIVEMITGGRLHPSWFRLGGVAMDLPEGWRQPIKRFVEIFEERLREYEKMVREKPHLPAAHRGGGGAGAGAGHGLGGHRPQPQGLRPGVGPAPQDALRGLRPLLF